MYVKVTHGDKMGGHFFTEAHGPLHWGPVAIPWPDHVAHTAHHVSEALARELGRQVLPPGEDDDIQPMPFNTCHVLEVNEDRRTVHERSKGILAVRCVWWDQPGDGLHAVVTTRNIFIVGDNGKTIDRV